MNPAPMPDTPWFNQLQARYGSGLTTNNTDVAGHLQQSLLWVTPEADVSLYLTRQTEQCGVLWVYQPHHEKDASDL